MAKVKFDLNNLKEYRKKLGTNQTAFWSSIGVTQSGSSRYENGRNLPRPTALLLILRETGKISEADLAAAMAVLKKARK